MKGLLLNSLSNEKNILRKEYRHRRKAFVQQLDSVTRNLVFRRIPSPLYDLITPFDNIAIYDATEFEAPTSRLILYLMEEGKNVLIPRVDNESSMSFFKVPQLYLLSDKPHPIAQPISSAAPVAPQLIIAPLVAFDRDLNRMGQGGGNYDRAFAKYPDAPRIGLAWSVQEAEKIPSEPHDVTLQMIITESEIIE